MPRSLLQFFCLTVKAELLWTDVNFLRDMSTGHKNQAKLSELVTKQKIILKQALLCEYIVVCQFYVLLHICHSCVCTIRYDTIQSGPSYPWRRWRTCARAFELGGLIIFHSNIFYLRQVNEVNGGDNAFVRCVSVCLCVRSGPVNGS